MRTDNRRLKFPAGFSILFFSILFLVFSFHNTEAEQKPPMQFAKKPEIQQVKPKKPVRIKLHRNANGEYTWDLTGDNVDEIVRADARLKKLLKLEKPE